MIMINDLLGLITHQRSQSCCWKFLSLSLNTSHNSCSWSSFRYIIPHVIEFWSYFCSMTIFNSLNNFSDSNSIKRKIFSLSINLFINSSLKLYFKDTMKMLKILYILFTSMVKLLCKSSFHFSMLPQTFHYWMINFWCLLFSWLNTSLEVNNILTFLHIYFFLVFLLY